MRYRKTNLSKRVSPSCGNHGSCNICRGNRLHAARVRELAAKVEELEEELRREIRAQDPFGI